MPPQGDSGVTLTDTAPYYGSYRDSIDKDNPPTVDNLLALSRLLRVPMEDLLVYEDQEVFHFFVINNNLKIKFRWPPGTYNAQILRAARACI